MLLVENISGQPMSLGEVAITRWTWNTELLHLQLILPIIFYA